MKNDGVTKIEVNGKSYDLVFNLNVMREIQARYKTVRAWTEKVDIDESGEPDVDALIFGFMVMLNEGIEIENETTGGNRPPLNERQTGRLITTLGFAKAGATIAQAMTTATDTGDDSKNE